MSPRKDGLDADQVGALRMLAGLPTGYTVTVMMEHGFKLEMLTEVVSNGLARSTRGPLLGGRRRLEGDLAYDHRRRTAGARREVGRWNAKGPSPSGAVPASPQSGGKDALQ